MNIIAESIPSVQGGNQSTPKLEIARIPIRAEQRADELRKRPAPLPLQRKTSAPKPFPFDLLGSLLGPLGKRLHEVVKAPDAICGQSVLAAAALIVQSHADVRIDGRLSVLSIFAITCGESGDRKSAIDAIVLKPVREHERSLYETHKGLKQKYRRDYATWQKQRDRILTSSKGWTPEAAVKSLEQLDKQEPVPPLEPYLLLEEPTYEGLTLLLAEGQPSLGLFSDEGGRMLGGHAMNKENDLKTSCGLSALWDGKPTSRIRAGDDNLLLYGRRLSLHLMMQEVVLAKIQRNPVLVSQGLLARCLVVYPPSNAGDMSYAEIDLSQDPVVRQYWAHVTSLLLVPLPLVNSRNELQPRMLDLNSQAKGLWIAFHDYTISQTNRDGPLFSVRRMAKKAPEYVLRIAGVLTLIDNLHAPCIEADAMARAVELMRWYLDEALRIADSIQSDPDLDLAEQVLDWMKRKAAEVGGARTFVLQNLYQGGPRGVRTAKEARHVVKILEDHGWIVAVGSMGREWRLME